MTSKKLSLKELLDSRKDLHKKLVSLGKDSGEVIASLHDLILLLSKSESISESSYYLEELKDLFKEVRKDFVGLGAHLSKLGNDGIIKNKHPNEAIPVRLVDKLGKDFYNATGGNGGGTFISDNKLSYGKGIVPIIPISVGATEQSFTIPSGKKYVAIQNKGPALVAFGPAGLNYSDYPTLTPRQFYEFIDCKDGFKVYFICDSGKTSTIVGFTR